MISVRYGVREGRSPRARGRRARYRWEHRAGGSIPACAGETVYTRARKGWEGVDPRVRGGDARKEWRRITKEGRSPRARGRRYALNRIGEKVGSIPACAGETYGRARAVNRWRVDPRVRGGDFCLVAGGYV